MATHLKFPLQIKNVTEDEDRVIKKYYKGYTRPFLRVGPQGYLLGPRYADHAEDIYNLEVRPDDIWVVTFSRSGTTWLQEMVWLIANNLDFENEDPLSKKYAFIEYPINASEEPKPPLKETSSKHLTATFEDFTTISKVQSPRYIKTHLPLSMLPPKLLDTAKVFYVARDTRDVAVSLFFMEKLFRYIDQDVKFEEFWELFKKDLILRAPVLPHVEEAWQKRNHPNMMFLFYEEMQKDLRNVIDRVCTSLGKEYSDAQKERLAEYLNFDNMRQKTSHQYGKEQKDSELKFLRKGKSGNWVNYFDDKMRQEAEEYMRKHFETTDMRFPGL